MEDATTWMLVPYPSLSKSALEHTGILALPYLPQHFVAWSSIFHKILGPLICYSAQVNTDSSSSSLSFPLLYLERC